MKMVVRPQHVAWNKKKMPFMFLPYHIFAECTNIAELLTKHEVEDKSIPPTDIQLADHIRKVHRQLHTVNWTLYGLDNLKFINTSESNTVEASIFDLKNDNDEIDNAKQLLVYEKATDFQRQFLFLPMPLLAQITNIREIAVMAISRLLGRKEVSEDDLIAVVHQIHAQIPYLGRWHLGKLDQLKFLRPKQEALPTKKTRDRSQKIAANSIPAQNPARNEEQPSTSRTYQQSSTSYRQNAKQSTLSNSHKSKETNKRAHEKTPNSAQPPDAVSPKRLKKTDSNRSASSNNSGRNESEREKSNISNKTSMSNTSDTTMHSKKAPNRAVKRTQQDPSDKPTKVQRRVIEMNEKQFVEQTNIKNLICREYGQLTNEELQKKIKQFFSLRSQWDAWKEIVCLNDLALKEDLSLFELSDPVQDVICIVDSDDDADTVTVKKPKVSSSATEPGTSSKLADSSKNTLKATSSSKSTTQKSSKSKKPALTKEQSELHKKLSPLSVEEFTKKTNVRELIENEIQKSDATPELFEQNIKKGIAKMFKAIQKPHKWHLCDLFQQFKFVNTEPSGNNQLNLNNNDAVPSSSEAENNKSVQVEMSPNNDEMLSRVSEIGVKTDANIQILPSTSSQALRPSEAETNVPIRSEQETCSNPTQYSTQFQCAQPSNCERLYEIPETQSQSMDNHDPKDVVAVDENDIDMMNVTPIPISSSTQNFQETNLGDVETQFDESSNAENLSQITVIPSNKETGDVTISNGSSTKNKSDYIIVLSDSDEEMQESQQSNLTHSQSIYISRVVAAIQGEKNIDRNLQVPNSMSTQKSQEENPDNPQLNADKSNSHKISNNEPTVQPINDGSTIATKTEPRQILPESQAIDSDIMCNGTLIESPIVIQNTDDEMEELYDLMGGSPIINGDSDSFGISNESRNQETTANNMTIRLSEERSTTEMLETEEVFSTTTITSETLMSVKSGSTIRSSPLQCIENTINVKRPTSNPVKRSIDQTDGEQIAAKRTKQTADDTLSNIEPPKYDYAPLQLINKQSNGTVHRTVGQKSTNVRTNDMSIHTDDDETSSSGPQIDSDHGTQPTTQASLSNIIEEFDSSCEMNESNEKTQDQSPMQSTAMKILTQDNTWFMNVNTQPMNDSNACMTIASSSTIMEQQISPLPTANNISMPQPVAMNSNEKSIEKIPSLISIPSNFRQNITFQYLHHINIEKFESKLLNEAGEQIRKSNLYLRYQCNGHSQIIVEDVTLKYILNVTDNEWNAVNQILSTIGDYTFKLKDSASHKSLLHRLIFYLFKTTSTFSKCHIEYTETDWQTVRASHVPYVIDNVDITPAFDPKFLKSLKNLNEMVKDYI